jgi:hypothetical protein
MKSLAMGCDFNIKSAKLKICCNTIKLVWMQMKLLDADSDLDVSTIKMRMDQYSSSFVAQRCLLLWLHCQRPAEHEERLFYDFYVSFGKISKNRP